MGEIKQPLPVLLFMAVFSSDVAAFDWSRDRAEARFGPIQLESKPFRFDTFTQYYAASMGEVIVKRLWAFRQLIDPAKLPEIKRITNSWEDDYKGLSSENVQRPLNLDPGYVDLGKLILASTKDHAHRIYLDNGIFAETTLMYTRKIWQALPWSYPDYQSEGYKQFLDQCRDYLKSTRNPVR